VSILSQFVKHNRDFAGNALKNIAPLSFLIPGVGPLAAAGLGAAGSALGRGIQHGGNLGNILKQGVEGGSMAYGGAQGLGAVKAAFAPSSSAVAAGGGGLGSTAGSAAGSVASPGAFPAIDGSGISAAPLSFASGTPQPGMLHDALSGVGHFIEHNPNTIGQGLQGIGKIGSMGANNRLLNAQAGMSEAELQAFKNRQAALQPLYAALLGQQQHVAPNPYAFNRSGA